MTDIAALGFSVDSSDTVAAKRNLDSMTDAANRAETAAAKLADTNKDLANATKDGGNAAKASASSLDGSTSAANEAARAQSELKRKTDETSRALNQQASAQDTVSKAIEETANQSAQAKQGGKLDPFKEVSESAEEGASALEPLQSLFETVTGSGIRLTASQMALAAGLTAFAAVALIATSAGMQYAYALDDVGLALRGVGSESGMTRGDVIALSEAMAEQENIAISSAREQAVAYLRMGVTNKQVIEGLIGVSEDYAYASGKEAVDAQNDLADAMNDVSGAGIQLLDSVGKLDAGTLNLIESLERQGNTQEAQILILGRVDEAVKNSANEVNGLALAWKNVLVFGKDAWDRFGHAVNMPFRNDYDAVIERYQGANFKPGMDKGWGKEYWDAIAARQAAQDKAAADANQAKLDDLGLAGDRAKKVLDPIGTRRQSINDYITAANNAYATGQMSFVDWASAMTGGKRQLDALDRRAAGPKPKKTPKPKETDDEKEVERALRESEKSLKATELLNAQQEKFNTLISIGATSTSDAAREMEIYGKTAHFQSAIDKATGAEKKKLTENVNKLTEEYRKQQDLKIASSIWAQVEAQGRSNEELDLEYSLIGKTNEERATAIAQYQAIQELKRLGGDKAVISPEGQALIDRATSGAVKQTRNDEAQYFHQLEENAKAYRQEAEIMAATMDMSREAAARYRIEQQLLNEATAKFGPLSEEQIADIEAIADTYGSVESMKILTEATEDWRSSLRGAFQDFFTGSASMMDIVTGLIMKFIELKAAQQFDKLWEGKLGDWTEGALSWLGFGSDGKATGGSNNAFDTSEMISLAGGGFTGSGPRSGGLDGKGGFLGIIHPHETMIDHTKPMPAWLRPRGGNRSVRPVVQLNAGNAVGPLADMLNRLERMINEGIDTSVERSTQAVRRSFSSYLEENNEFG